MLIINPDLSSKSGFFLEFLFMNSIFVYFLKTLKCFTTEYLLQELEK